MERLQTARRFPSVAQDAYCHGLPVPYISPYMLGVHVLLQFVQWRDFQFILIGGNKLIFRVVYLTDPAYINRSELYSV